jgi:hypothetical protein
MTKDEVLKLALEYIETNAHERRHVRWAIKEALAQPVPESSACCHACFKASGAILMTRMILCPTCGNKRCPRASDHRLECTDINEPGQTGSVYTALLPVQPAQPEPTATYTCGVCGVPMQMEQPTQRPWVGLTDEEIDLAIGFVGSFGARQDARAIEAKLKEKNT